MILDDKKSDPGMKGRFFFNIIFWKPRRDRDTSRLRNAWFGDDASRSTPGKGAKNGDKVLSLTKYCQ